MDILNDSNSLNLSYCLRCRMENACSQVGSFKRINPDKSLIIDSGCTEQCDVALSMSYQFEVFMNMGTLNQPNWVLFEDKQGFLEGK